MLDLDEIERLARAVARGERAPDDLHAELSQDVALALVSRIRELEGAQDRHLALIAELSKTAPYEGEAKELRGQIAALIAEVGTLRAKEKVR